MICVSRAISGLLLGIVIVGSGALFAETPEQQALDILRSGTNENNAGKRTEAVRALRLLPHCPQGTEMAEAALKDPKEDVRVAAALALGEMGAKEAIPVLKESLTDSKLGVVLAAARSLQLLGDPAGGDVFYELLVGERKSQGLISQEVNSLNTKKVVEFGVQEGLGFIPFGGTGYSAVKALRKDAASTSRALAAEELAKNKDKDPRINRALLQAATSDKSWLVRASALLAIAKRGNPQMLNAIVAALSDENQVVRYTAATAVVRLSKLIATTSGAKDNAKDNHNVLSDRSKD